MSHRKPSKAVCRCVGFASRPGSQLGGGLEEQVPKIKRFLLVQCNGKVPVLQLPSIVSTVFDDMIPTWVPLGAMHNDNHQIQVGQTQHLVAPKKDCIPSSFQQSTMDSCVSLSSSNRKILPAPGRQPCTPCLAKCPWWERMWLMVSTTKSIASSSAWLMMKLQ